MVAAECSLWGVARSFTAAQGLCHLSILAQLASRTAFFKIPFLLAILVFNYPTFSNSFIQCILFEHLLYELGRISHARETGEQNRQNLGFHMSQ